MSRPGTSEPKNWATNSLSSGFVSQVACGLLFRFWVRMVDESVSGPPVGHTNLAAGVVAATARTPVIRHSNRGCQFTSEEYQRFLEVHNGTSFGLIGIEALVTVAWEVKEWISAHALKR